MPRGKKALTNSALIKRKFEEPSMEEYELHQPYSHVEEPQNTKRKLTNSTEIIIASKENPIVISEEEGLKDMTCPVCNILIKNADDNIMDKHIDYCLSSAILEEEERLQQVQEKPIPKIPKKVERIMEDEMDEMGEMGIEIPREEEKEEEEESEEEEEKKVKSKRKPTKKAKKVEKEVIADSVEKEKEKVVDDVEKDTIKADSEEKGKEKVDDTTDPNWTPASCLLINASSFTTPKNFEDRFVEISDHLLNTVALVINGKRYRFTELEYYFTSSTHNDPFTHCDDVQYTLANWYFHRSGKSYKSGSYKGLDISIGNSEKEAGGILIRSIESLDGTASVVCGPSKTVDKILELCKAEQNVKGFVEEHLKKKSKCSKNPR